MGKMHSQRLIFLSVLLIIFCTCTRSLYVKKTARYYSLDGIWSAVSSNKSIVVPAKVPGSIYTDLLRSKIIKDPYYRDNDVLYRWIGRDDWMFYRKFDVECHLLQKDRVILVFHGLDTISQIFLNEKLIGGSTNMFLRTVIDVKNVIQTNNVINVTFQSAVKYAEVKHEQQLVNYVIPPTCPPPVQKGECHVNYVRKIQSSFSWDWGPSFPTQGIWKPVELIGFDSIIIRDVTVFTQKISSNNGYSSWQLNVKVYAGTASHSSVKGVLSVYLKKVLLANFTTSFIPDNSFSSNISFSVKVPQNIAVDLWWPNGLGDHNLYELTVSFYANEEYSSKSVKIGFRTLELIQEPVHNSSGLSFFIRVNGIPFFAKGSNWIPADSFPERITVEYIRSLLQSAKDANMNMLRVWGGGMYESDDFYNIADEMGILIWQDIMFAVALYPVHQDFLDSVAAEVQQQVRRLQHHPSLLLWAANNENEQGIAQRWWPVVAQNLQQYKSDYVKLYINTVMPVIEAEDPSRPFLSSSPSNGLQTKTEGWIASDPQDTHYGDMHFYNYIADGWSWKTYPRARFVSEYGYQSYPSFESFLNVSEPNDWTYPIGEFLMHRQHHMFGNLQILTMISKHMNLPSESCRAKGFIDLLYLSQIIQAVSVKIETERYRRSMSEVVNGEGKTMGALYWQLNDIWQGPSWSSIEYGGKWKMLHYYAKDFFAPLLISPYVDNGSVIAYVVSDMPVIVNITVNVIVYKWSSFQPTYYKSLQLNQNPLTAEKIYAENLNGENGLLEKGKCNSEKECFIFFTLSSNTREKIQSQNFAFLSELKDAVGLQRSKITVSSVTGPFVTRSSNNAFKILLNASHISVFVWLEVPTVKGKFSENGFIMVEKSKSVMFYSEIDVTADVIAKIITVRSLTDVCQ